MTKRRPARILVADDNRGWADSLGELLGLMGYGVQVVYGGREAIEAAAGMDPDVVLLDIRMPEMSGYEAARIFRQERPSRPVLVAVTAWEGSTMLAKLAGFDHHMTKPLHLPALAKLIDGAAAAAPLPAPA